MLQDADPTGEKHIRLVGEGMPLYAYAKPGYYDGPFTYVEDGKLHLSADKEKVDIYADNGDDFVERNHDWKDKLVFEMSCYVNKSQAEEKKNAFIESLSDTDDIMREDTK